MFREPLLIPLAGFAAGIVLSQFALFSPVELGCAAAGLAALAVCAHFRGSRLLTAVCVGLAMACAGSFTEVLRRPGPPPELEGGEGEVLLVSGCVVDPP